MKTIKHNKIKNTGILFELLARQVTADILTDGKQLSAKLVKKYFSTKKPLGRELQLYQTLMRETFKSETQANRFLDEVIKQRKRLTNSILRREKYNLIKEIKKNYPVEDFFRSKIKNYKIYASISNLFLAETSQDEFSPSQIVQHRGTIVEHVLHDKVKSKKIQEQSAKIKSYEKADKDLRLLSYKILVERFNKKYTSLNSRQKDLLQNYVNNISNTNSLREHLNNEVVMIKTILKNMIPTIADKVTKIKVNEAYKQSDKLVGTRNKTVKDKNVLSLMRYYELVKELRDVSKSIKKKVIK